MIMLGPCSPGMKETEERARSRAKLRAAQRVILHDYSSGGVSEEEANLQRKADRMQKQS